MNRTKMPRTDSIQELARFWDTHDLTDFEDELEAVNAPIFEFLTQYGGRNNGTHKRSIN